MSTPAAKRRRIDAANQALSKPFRSPFKTPVDASFKSPIKESSSSASISQDSTGLGGPEPTTASPAASTNLPLAPKSTNIHPSTPLHLTHPKRKTTFSSPLTTNTTTSSPLHPSSNHLDPDVTPLLHTQRSLSQTLRGLTSALDVATQAQQIETASLAHDPTGEVLDGELVALRQRWQAASRRAAEELFAVVRDRVNRMGGPRVWKEMQKRQDEWRREGDEGDAADTTGDGEEGEGEKRDLYAEYGIDPETETENERSQRAGGGDTGELPGQEDEFTMAMMLRTLNVELATIGYDKVQERWTD